ncbi:MAG: hypothetical protein IJ734_08555, partial [Fibrobacter sp.]|nr:hypothetical protein [Fibrobacter sp.]
MFSWPWKAAFTNTPVTGVTVYACNAVVVAARSAVIVAAFSHSIRFIVAPLGMVSGFANFSFEASMAAHSPFVFCTMPAPFSFCEQTGLQRPVDHVAYERCGRQRIKKRKIIELSGNP